MQPKKRVVVAGLGETGILVALNLPARFEVVGIAPKPILVSGQELGMRLARPDLFRRFYVHGYRAYRGLRDARVVHGIVERVADGHVDVARADGSRERIPYDALVIATGVTNGFWRDARLEDADATLARMAAVTGTLADARRIAIVGAGASGCSAASNLRERYPDKEVHLFFAQQEPLPEYHPRVRATVRAKLVRDGVVLHPGHRAEIDRDFAADRITQDPVRFLTGQPPFEADAVLWTVGRQRPNTATLPATMLDEHGYVKVDSMLQVPGHPGTFAVGDVAASDPNRSTARNSGFLTVAHNVTCLLDGRPERMRRFVPTTHRWGSVLGVQDEGMRVFAPNGFGVRLARLFAERFLFPIVVHRFIYKGLDAESDEALGGRAAAGGAPRPDVK